MKYLKALSSEKPATAETAFLQLKNVLSGNLTSPSTSVPSSTVWFNHQIETLLRK